MSAIKATTEDTAQRMGLVSSSHTHKGALVLCLSGMPVTTPAALGVMHWRNTLRHMASA